MTHDWTIRLVKSSDLLITNPITSVLQTNQSSSSHLRPIAFHIYIILKSVLCLFALLWFDAAAFCVLWLWSVCVCVCPCVHTDGLLKQTTMSPLHNTYNFSCRLLKSRLEKEELDGRLKDLQQSTLATKTQTAASDSSAEVIYISRQADYCRLRLAVWANCGGLIATAVVR